MGTRKSFSDNTHILLYHEVGGVCPKCAKVLMYKKKNEKHRGYDVAHIYPLNPNSEEVTLLVNEEKLSENPNDEKNLVLMCRSCHSKFDKPRTVEEYRWLVKKKKELSSKVDAKSLWHDNQIEEEVREIIEKLSSENLPDETDALNMSLHTIDEKTDDTIQPITKFKIKSNVKSYFLFIRNVLSNLEKESPNTADLISAQIRLYYLLLKKKGYDQQKIFSEIVDWVHTKTDQVSKDACEVLVSFFVQNCEVFK